MIAFHFVREQDALSISEGKPYIVSVPFKSLSGLFIVLIPNNLNRQIRDIQNRGKTLLSLFGKIQLFSPFYLLELFNILFLMQYFLLPP